MTPIELRAAILALGLTNSEAARRLGMTPRSMRRLLSGEHAVNERTEQAIRALMVSPSLAARDEWIVGEGPPPERREYVIHAAAPRFIARVVQWDALTDRPEPDEEPVDLGGVGYHAGEQSLICEIAWIDPAPAEPREVTRLMEAAADALDGSAAT